METDEPGQRLKQARERLNLRYRDVEDASNQIARRRGSDEFVIALSRLSDIENKGTVPSIFRLYTLCTIYRLEVTDVMEWYGVNLANQANDAASIEIKGTHPIRFGAYQSGDVQMPLALDPGVDLKKTTFLSRMVQRWGKLPLSLLGAVEARRLRFAFVGSEDWSMYPLIRPESLVMIDDTQKKIVNSGWTDEYDRPIYFLEHRSGYYIGWCYSNEKQVILLSHPSSQQPPQVFAANEIDVLGQITGVAMSLEGPRKRNTHA